MGHAGADYRMLIMPDHPTPICCRTHTSDPIPYLLYDSRKAAVAGAGEKKAQLYNEAAAKDTGIFIPKGYTLIDRLFAE